MRTWATFFYGIAAGLLVAYVMGQLLYAVTAQWLLIGSAISLAIALIIHQRHVSKSKGRRWKKTI